LQELREDKNLEGRETAEVTVIVGTKEGAPPYRGVIFDRFFLSVAGGMGCRSALFDYESAITCIIEEI